MLLTALALTVLSAEPRTPLAVTVSSKRAGAEQLAAKLATKVHTAFTAPLSQDETAKLLKKSGFDAKACAGTTPCLLKAALALGPHAVVIGVDVGKVAKSLAVHLEAVAADAAEPIAVSDFSAPADDWDGPSSEPIAAFVKQVTDQLNPPKQDELKRAPDAPAVTSLEPPPPSPAPAPVVTARSSSSPRILPIASAVVAAASLVTSGVFLILGLQEKSVVDRSIMGSNSELTQPDFNAHKSRGNLYFTISLSTLLAGVAFGAVAGVLFGTST